MDSIWHDNSISAGQRKTERLDRHGTDKAVFGTLFGGVSSLALTVKLVGPRWVVVCSQDHCQHAEVACKKWEKNHTSVNFFMIRRWSHATCTIPADIYLCAKLILTLSLGMFVTRSLILNFTNRIEVTINLTPTSERWSYRPVCCDRPSPIYSCVGQTIVCMHLWWWRGGVSMHSG